MTRLRQLFGNSENKSQTYHVGVAVIMYITPIRVI